MREVRALRGRVKCDSAAHLVVGPVLLEERSERELLPHGELLGGAYLRASINGDGDHNGVVRVDLVGLHVVARLAQRGDDLGRVAHAHAADVEAALRSVHAGRGPSQQRHGSGRLNGRGLDGARDGEPLRIFFVAALHVVVALVSPVLERVHAAGPDELGNAAHGAADAAVAEHDAVALGPVRLPERDGLGVEKSRLERLLEVVEVGVVVREGLHEAAELVGLEGLLQAGVATGSAPVAGVLDAVHPAVVAHVVEPGKTGLAIVADALDHLGVVHAEAREDRVVAGPAEVGAVRVEVVVLEVDVLF
mmetsp:Transcript_20734/g.66142  ORF Transcript_20734/g.66142 Transcript_20734/m.66142 type:complete len:306 (-) Transcript_20734:675-1592(-)